MKIVLFGAGGLIGSYLRAFWQGKHEMLFATRDKSLVGDSTFYWNPAKGELDLEMIEGADMFINLAGENISTRWTDNKKENIVKSRIQSSSLIAKKIGKLKKPPKVWIQASAVGFYGSRGDERLSEESSHGEGFLAHVCQKWEDSTKEAANNTRVVLARFGVVLSQNGGALKKMLLPFRLGLGGPLGSGKQWMSWISIKELPFIFMHIFNDEMIKGPVNVVAPNVVTNGQFTRSLAASLDRYAPFPLPSFIVRTLFGQMADELLLSSTKVEPKVLLTSGYEFRYNPLQKALEELLK